MEDAILGARLRHGSFLVLCLDAPVVAVAVLVAQIGTVRSRVRLVSADWSRALLNGGSGNGRGHEAEECKGEGLCEKHVDGRVFEALI
jgi:hypothetical protein